MTENSAASGSAIKVMKLRYAGTCECGNEVAAGTRAGYDKTARSVVCPDCLALPEAEPPIAAAVEEVELAPPEQVEEGVEIVETGVPGSSLRREHERLVAAREKRVRGKHPRLGGLILALSDEPATTRAFAIGADGEERLAARLERDCAPDVLFLHNRKLGKGRRDGDIDHIAIAPSGIFLIDAKRYLKSKVRIVRSGGIFSPVREQLMVGGRDRSKVLEGCAKQIAALTIALDGHPLAARVAVRSVLCFIDADLPLFGTMQAKGVRLLGPKGTIKVVTVEGDLDAEARASLHRHLAAALPSA
jgi:hypothetical protein